jgi:hypothetical protein
MSRQRTFESVVRGSVLAVTLVTSVGCSFVFVRGPKTGPREAPKVDARGNAVKPDCTSSRLAPIVDSVAAAGFLCTAAAGAKCAAFIEINGDASSAASVAANLAAMGLFLGSAVYGYVTTANCDKWKEERQAERVRQGDQLEHEMNSVARIRDSRAPNPPAEFAGFTFGWTPEQAGEACSRVQGEWTSTASEASCSKVAAPVGFDGEVSLTITDGRVYGVKVVRKAGDEAAGELKDSFVNITESLNKAYGRPNVAVFQIPSACQKTLAKCLREQQARISVRWLWPERFEVAADVTATDRAVMLVLDHRTLIPMVAPRTTTAPASSAPPPASAPGNQ